MHNFKHNYEIFQMILWTLAQVGNGLSPDHLETEISGANWTCLHNLVIWLIPLYCKKAYFPLLCIYYTSGKECLVNTCSLTGIPKMNFNKQLHGNVQTKICLVLTYFPVFREAKKWRCHTEKKLKCLMAMHLTHYPRTSELQINCSGNAIIERCYLKLFKVKGGF